MKKKIKMKNDGMKLKIWKLIVYINHLRYNIKLKRKKMREK